MRCATTNTWYAKIKPRQRVTHYVCMFMGEEEDGGRGRNRVVEERTRKANPLLGILGRPLKQPEQQESLCSWSK